MYIKAKYPKVGNEYGGPQAKAQGFGSLYGGNHDSTITNEDNTHAIYTENSSSFPNTPWEFSTDFSNDFKIKL